MKKYFAIAGIVIMGMSSCSKDFLKEDPKGNLTTENFYKTTNDLNMATIALYTQINGAFNQSAGFSTLWGGDDMTVARAGNKISYSDFDTYQATSSNDRMTNWWSYFYSTIKSCNALINNYKNATQASEDDRNHAAGQAYFLRALSYFFLTRTWGEVPLVTDNTVDYTRTKAEPADIYALILSDLQNAETMLPDGWDGTRKQNGVDIPPTRGSAKALLANVYLTMAGWPLKQTDKYALAAAKAKEVIDNKATWGYELATNFIDLWQKSGKFNHETVFGCYYNVNVSGWAWENYNMLTPNAYAPDDEGGWGDGYGEINFYKKFPAGPRKNATYQSVYYINNVVSDSVDYTGTLHKHPYFFKFRDDDAFNPVNHVNSNWIGSHTVFVIRYAEVLLTYAEAQAMSSTPDATAYSAINAVRNRAGLADLQAGLSQTAFRDSVIAERGWEFAGVEPAARWYDLIRTETVAKANSDRDASEEVLKNIPSDETHTFYWAPIPIGDQQLNSNL
ncbi:SusD family protein [Chitinophaga sp. CF118]|uniref:RagB/SusD family nutrient uptake outer membrane protein n=1 Tax=Chitinophaga sp. CF118 TaxID=1884367 RepID=UPI0008E719CF|nr:RagB/SusD family nutrient uptake outer membrane protein [Chitinophaga sp. CF118]SFD80091.1 SusD family protein [Chitinophaga sp. CF118]